MGKVLLTHLDCETEFQELKEFFEYENPGLRLTIAEVDGEGVLRSQHGGMRVYWLYRGLGEILLPKGYRTKEGDGRPLPGEYQPDPVSPAFAEALRILKNGPPSLAPAAGAAVQAILKRWNRETFTGDFAGELWKLEHCPRPWSKDPEVESSIESLFTIYREQGHSTKESESYEPIVPGDQVVTCGEEEIRVRGQFICLCVENTMRNRSHISTARRLRYLADSSGGCNPDFDPFRRLPLTWHLNYPGESGDGLNWANSHVVNIPKETSPTHFHPPRSIGGPGLPQREMYLVLDPQVWNLNTWGRSASLTVFPDLLDLRQSEEIPLEPAMFVYIPPGTGHRGLDVFVNVLTIPGFKPHNEYYIDRDIRDCAAGASPYNENLLESKNYSGIRELL
ncbi:MAG: hypothetical protein L0170_07185 [Acidobacteria bacterium]|nr:hypothetical protein [Acidobacteriota bacterium]